jgi:hypothetical protein
MIISIRKGRSYKHVPRVDPIWDEVPHHVWDYSRTDWVKQLMDIRDDVTLTVRERVDRIKQKVEEFEFEVRVRQRVAESQKTPTS